MDEPLTPLQADIAATGRRCWRMRESNYKAFRVQLDNARGFPKGRGTRAVTERAIPDADDMPRANDGSGHLLVNLSVHYVRGDIPLEENPHVEALTVDDWRALMPEPEEQL